MTPEIDSSLLAKLDRNNRYLFERMKRENRPGFRALDHGCGNGGLVFAAREAGIDAYGAETFYDGARPEDLELIRKHDPESTFVRSITDGKLAFPDGFFDLIVANQVFEHIHDLDAVARELRRVLKPGGSILSIFPIRSVVREPHLWVPFIHRMPKGRFRRAYYRLTRTFSKRARSIDWGTGPAAIDKAFWFMDTHTCYRDIRQIREIFAPLFAIQFIEPNWLAFRLPRLAKLKHLPGARRAATIFTHFAAGTVLLAVKRPEP